MRFVFLHGGPGFNSFAEQAILGPVWRATEHEIVFWNEPSRLRPDGDPFEVTGAFERWLASAEQFVLRSAGSERVHLIAHSFTPHAAMEIARRYPDRLASLTVVAPAADPFVTFCNVLRIGRDDLAPVAPEAATVIADCLGRTRFVLDEAMREGVLAVLQDDRLFTHYFADPEQFRAAMTARARPGGEFDLESFFAVLTDFGERGGSLLSTDPVIIPTLALFGAQDRITPIDEQRQAVRAAIPDCRMHVLEGCSHHLHLDRPRPFSDIVIDWAASSGSTSRSP
jgi:pimeloyl-ACP methyl ester carboxylesterase